jgi:hypothetical protein
VSFLIVRSEGKSLFLKMLDKGGVERLETLLPGFPTKYSLILPLMARRSARAGLRILSLGRARKLAAKAPDCREPLRAIARVKTKTQAFARYVLPSRLCEQKRFMQRRKVKTKSAKG